RDTAADVRRPWGLVVGTVAFAAWAPPSLVGLPFAALMLATRPRARAEWLPALVVGATSLALLVAPAGDLLTGLVRAYVVLATADRAAAVRTRPRAVPRVSLRGPLGVGPCGGVDGLGDATARGPQGRGAQPRGRAGRAVSLAWARHRDRLRRRARDLAGGARR